MTNAIIPALFAALPEITVFSMALIALLAELFFPRQQPRLSYGLVQLGLVIAAVITLLQFNTATEIVFHHLYIKDNLASLMKFFIALTGFAAFVHSRHYIVSRDIPQSEYYILGLFSILGMMVLVSAYSLLTIFLGLELLSLPLYAMVALRRDSSVTAEAAMKYFVMGAMASGMLLYGMSMIYGATGGLDLARIAEAVSQLPETSSLMLAFGLVFIIAGIAFKLAAAPFHMWAPDVYTGAPSSVTLFLSTAPKIAALAMLIRLLLFALPDLFVVWQQFLIILAVLSIIIGNLLAIVQANLKRMLAYSGISHIGYMLLGLIAGTTEGYTAALFYMIIYALMTVGGFSLITMLSHKGFEAEHIDDFKGLNARNPWLALMMMLVMFSMAGIPPLVGFFAKLMVLKALLAAGYITLTIFALVFAVIGCFYYIRVIKAMYFDAPREELGPIQVPASAQVVVSVNGLALLFLGLFPGVILYACRIAFTQ